MPYVKVTNRHKGDDGKARVPGDVVHVSSVEAERRIRDGQVKATETPKPQLPKRPRPAAQPAPRPPAVKAKEPERKDTGEGS